MKIFLEEIRVMFQRLKSGTKFAFSKYADGEWMAITKTLATPAQGEWSINPSIDNKSINLLNDSFLYTNENYFVGISCPCCQGVAHYEMKSYSNQPEQNLTFANIFVNYNYKFYLENFIPYFSRQSNIYLVANKLTDINNLPFKVEKFYGINYNAWVTDLELINNIKQDIKNKSDKLFLFSAGPFGNILAHQLWDFNKHNQYIDIGSTIDPWTKSNKMPRYYDNNEFSEKVCIWG